MHKRNPTIISVMLVIHILFSSKVCDQNYIEVGYLINVPKDWMGKVSTGFQDPENFLCTL